MICFWSETLKNSKKNEEAAEVDVIKRDDTNVSHRDLINTSGMNRLFLRFSERMECCFFFFSSFPTYANSLTFIVTTSAENPSKQNVFYIRFNMNFNLSSFRKFKALTDDRQQKFKYVLNRNSFFCRLAMLQLSVRSNRQLSLN